MSLTGDGRIDGVLNVAFLPGQTPVGGDYDLWFCPDRTVLPDDGADDNGDCIGPFIQNRNGTTETQFVLTLEFFGDDDSLLESLCGTELIVHDYSGGGHSNWLAWDCGFGAEVPNPMTLACLPDPVAVGAVVTCEVEFGDPSIDILWAASYGTVFASQGVTLGADGRGTFTFVAPAAAQGLPVTVELVEWDPISVVQVSGTAVPTRLPAGEGQNGLPLGVTLAGLMVLAGAGVLRLRRAGAAA
jgi:hypothetical protein